LFARLERYTGEHRYNEIAQRTLEAFAGQQEALGHFAAGYARTVDVILHPQTDVRIVGERDAVAELHRAALRLRVADRTVQVLDPARDGQRLAALGLPPEPAAVAYVCAGTLCSAPVRTPEALQAAVTEMRLQAEATEAIPIASKPDRPA
jgi:uncharacterized protein YyaL (SSP411 family)